MLKDIATGVLITCLILAVSMLIPIVGFFCSLLLPLPTVYYRIKLGRRNSILIPIIGLVMLVVMMSTTPFDMVFVAALFIMGFSLGELLGSPLSIEKIMLGTCAWVWVGGALSLIFLSVASGHNLLAGFSQAVANNRDFLMHLYQSMGMPAENMPVLTRFLDEIQKIVIRILPALIITTTLFVIWINLLLARSLLKRRHMPYPATGKLNSWQAPDYLVWGVIGCGLLMLIPDDFAKTFGLNGLITLMMIYFFQGIAIVSFFFEKKRVPRAAKIMLYTLIAFQEIMLVVIVIGFFDVWANFRKLESTKP